MYPIEILMVSVLVVVALSLPLIGLILRKKNKKFAALIVFLVLMYVTVVCHPKIVSP